MSTAEPLVALDAQHPWPGLTPYGEGAAAYFHGRDAEAEELLRLIRRETLTVLFGQSGLGKSSLLNAGLFPRLRAGDFLPVYLRLDVSDDAPDLVAQVKDTLVAAAGKQRVDAPRPDRDDTLWTVFHRQDADFWSARNRLLTPVLVFDQFEEIFTLGRHNDALRRRCDALIAQIADLVEDNVPDAVVRRLEDDAAFAATIDYAKRNYKVVLTFREDYLPDFEGLRGTIRSIMKNRMRLTRMNGLQAREAIALPGAALVDDAVTDRIIRFVAAPRAAADAGADTEWERLEIEPALLSVVCRELNNKRIASGQARITADLLEGGAQQEIIADFYERSLADIDPRVRAFVEDELLTESGYRDSFALDDALKTSGMTREAIDLLVLRRLLRLEDRAGVVRIELTHDLLTRVAKESRDRRKAREATARQLEVDAARRRRTRRFAAFAATGGAIAVGLAVTFAILFNRAVEEKNRVVETQSDVMFAQAIAGLERNVAREPYARLAEALRLNHNNAAAAARAVSLLSQRSSGTRQGIALLDSSARAIVHWRAPDRILVESPAWLVFLDTSDPQIRTWAEIDAPVPDLANHGLARLRLETGPGPKAVTRLGADGTAGSPGRPFSYDPESRLLLWLSIDGVLLAFDTDTRERIGAPILLPPRTTLVRLSRDRRFLAAALADGSVAAWRLDNAAALAPLFAPWEPVARGQPTASDGERTIDRVRLLRWHPADHRLLIQRESGVAAMVAVDPAGTVLERREGDTVQRFRVARRSEPVAFERIAGDYGFSPGGRYVAGQGGPDVVLHRLDRPGADPVRLRHPADLNSFALSADDRWLATACQDQHARIWDPATGSPGIAPLRHEGAVRAVAFDADGGLLATSSTDGTVRIWDTATGEPAFEPLLHPAVVRSLAFAPDRKGIAAMTADGWLTLWRLPARGERIALLEGTAPVTAADVAATGHHAAIGRADGTIELWQLPALSGAAGASLPKMLWSTMAEGAVTAVRFTATSDAFVTGQANGAIAVWRASKASRAIATARADGAVRQIELSENGRTLVTTAGSTALRIWSLPSLVPVGVPLRHDGAVRGMRISPDGRSLASFSTDRRLNLWDLSTGVRFAAMEARAPVSSVDFDREGGRLVVTSGSRISLLDLKPGPGKKAARAGQLVTHKDAPAGRYVDLGAPIATAQLSADRTQIVTGDAAGVAQRWDLATLKAAGAPMRHDGPVRSARFSSDARWIVTATNDLRIHVWDPRTGQRIADPYLPRPDTAVSTAVLTGDLLVFGSGANTVAATVTGFGFPVPSPGGLRKLLEERAQGYIDETGRFVTNDIGAARSGSADRRDEPAGPDIDAWWQRWADSLPTGRTPAPARATP